MSHSVARVRRILRLRSARPDLPGRTLFHAGPPYKGVVPRAVLLAAAQAALIEGYAATLEEAVAAIQDGSIKLDAAQDHGFAVPLAMVLSPAMWCVEVGDDTSAFYAAMSEGPAPALRFGSDAPDARARATEWCAVAAEAIGPCLSRLPPVEAMIQAALERGDECHAITAAGNQIIVDGLGEIDQGLRNELLRNPSFALCIWMAWAGWKLESTKSPIAAIGGNGTEFGWRPRGSRVWHSIGAAAPAGTVTNANAAGLILGAVGDSALIDICGLGGQALQHSPSLCEEWKQVLPPDAGWRQRLIVNSDSGIVTPSLVTRENRAPIINLAMVNREGGGMPLGRGICLIPPSLFSIGS